MDKILLHQAVKFVSCSGSGRVGLGPNFSTCSGLGCSGVAMGWTGVDTSTPLLLEIAPEIDTKPTSFYRGVGRGIGPVKVRT